MRKYRDYTPQKRIERGTRKDKSLWRSAPPVVERAMRKQNAQRPKPIKDTTLTTGSAI